jgi:hypothetical protein
MVAETAGAEEGRAAQAGSAPTHVGAGQPRRRSSPADRTEPSDGFSAEIACQLVGAPPWEQTPECATVDGGAAGRRTDCA